MEAMKSHKQSSAGEFPKDWEILPLKNVSSLHGRIGWQGLKQSEFTMHPEDPFLITGMNFDDGEIKWGEVYHIPQSRYEEAKPIQLKPGDVLMTKDGTIGKMLYVDNIPYPGKASLNSHLLVFRPLYDRYVPKFLFYQLNSKTFHDYIEIEKSGSTFFGITQAAVEKYTVYLPPIPEQFAIANALSDMDAMIVSLDKVIAKMRLIKQGTMQQLLTGKKRLPGYNERWSPIQLKDLLKYERPDKYIVYDTEYSERGDIPVLTANKTFILGYTHEDFGICLDFPVIVFDDFTTDSKYVDFPFKVKSSAIKLLRPKNEQIDLKFIFYKMHLIQLSLGDHKRYYISEYQNIQLEIPDLDEQSAITATLSAMDAEISALELRSEKIRLLKQGMMQELLNGSIRLI